MKETLKKFMGAVEKRLEHGEREHGQRSLDRPLKELAREIAEELEDVAGWSVILWKRLKGIEAELAEPGTSRTVYEAEPGKQSLELLLKKGVVRLELPWNEPPLQGWNIVGMNHYNKDGKRYLYVSMTKWVFGISYLCIKAEGEDEHQVFLSLQEQAEMHGT